MKSPIFLFSLPRSGSTLLQRVLMGHKDIASIAEPWIMLPFSYAYKRDGVLAEYSHDVSFKAIEDFISNLPHKEEDYFTALGIFARTLYEKQCSNKEQYFLDKTPRYYNIIPEIVKTFPDAKFIFLFRNPIHVKSSIIQTWCNGSLRGLYSYEQDLNYGPEALSSGYKLLQDKAYAIQYEKFVINPSKYTKEMCEYLGIKFDENMLETFSLQNTKGRLGDPTGVKEYKTISKSSLDKWKNNFNTRFRKKLAYNYMNSIKKSVFDTQGYDKESLLKEIKELKVENKYLIKDKIDYIYSLLMRYTKANILFKKSTTKWSQGKYLS